MDPLTIAVKVLINGAIQSHSQKKAEEARKTVIPYVEEYYMTFFGAIPLKEEREWILQNKIRPIINTMDNKGLARVLKTKEKNDKLIKKNKPIKDEIIKRETVLQYHQEYIRFKKEQQRQDEMSRMKREKDEENKKQAEKITAVRKKYIYENGENDAELARKLF